MPVEHTVKLRVRFAETDAMQVVYYAEYFVWFEVARTELFRAIGIPYSVISRKRGFHTPVVQAHADYKSSARYDDEVAVKVWASKVGTSSDTVHVLIGEDGKSKEIPADIKERLSA
jgi:acyl-CoA thioester hydrolase